jgi:ketosteroid isomerase-like protein
MKIRLAVALIFACAVPALAQSPEQIIPDKTKKFTQAIVTKDLSVLDDVFEKDPDDLFFDINEGPLVGFDRLKRVWTAATSNYTISSFDFTNVKIMVDGDHAFQIGTWTQTLVTKDAQSRDVRGRATILWRKRDGQWRVWHYHASITPPRHAMGPPR